MTKDGWFLGCHIVNPEQCMLTFTPWYTGRCFSLKKWPIRTKTRCTMLKMFQSTKAPGDLHRFFRLEPLLWGKSTNYILQVVHSQEKCYKPLDVTAVAVSELPGYLGRRQKQCAISLWVEKNPVPPPNHPALDWSVVFTVGQLCPIVPQDNIVVSNKHNWPEFYQGSAWPCLGLEPPMCGWRNKLHQ